MSDGLTCRPVKDIEANCLEAVRDDPRVVRHPPEKFDATMFALFPFLPPSNSLGINPIRVEASIKLHKCQ